MIWLVLVSLLIIIAYTTAVCIKGHGVPNSISATFYKLDHKLWCGATMFLTSGLLMPAILETTPPSYQFTVFLACTGMISVGIAPHFREGLERPIHITGAILCLVFSQVWVALTCPWYLIVWIVYLIYTIIEMIRHQSDSVVSDFLRTNPMFWAEITALVCTYMSLFFNY